jgi:hypothetical protein
VFGDGEGFGVEAEGLRAEGRRGGELSKGGVDGVEIGGRQAETLPEEMFGDLVAGQATDAPLRLNGRFPATFSGLFRARAAAKVSRKKKTENGS